MSKLHLIVSDENAFLRQNGSRIHSLHDLQQIIANIDADEFNHHVNAQKNDFANWVEHVFSNRFLANTLRALKTSQQMALALDVALNPQKKHALKEQTVDEIIGQATSSASLDVNHSRHTDTHRANINTVRVSKSISPHSLTSHALANEHNKSQHKASPSRLDDVHDDEYDVHKHIKHLEGELAHMLKYHKHPYTPVTSLTHEDIRSKLVDFLFGMVIGIVMGLLFAKTIGL